LSFQTGRPRRLKLRLSATLAILAAALLLSISLGSAENSNQLSLSIYVDNDFTKALVAGYACQPDSLSHLDWSECIYEEETGMLYAVTGSLIELQSQGGILRFPLSGDYDEYHAIFYIPSGAELREIDCSYGLEFLSSSYNDSLVLNVQGFDVSDPEVVIQFLIF